jgi:hypothetical protein
MVTITDNRYYTATINQSLHTIHDLFTNECKNPKLLIVDPTAIKTNFPVQLYERYNLLNRRVNIGESLKYFTRIRVEINTIDLKSIFFFILVLISENENERALENPINELDSILINLNTIKNLLNQSKSYIKQADRNPRFCQDLLKQLSTMTDFDSQSFRLVYERQIKGYETLKELTEITRIQINAAEKLKGF